MRARAIKASDLVRNFATREDAQFINHIVDGDFTRDIRRRQFSFAMCTLACILIVLFIIIGLDIWRNYWGLPGVSGSCATCDAAAHALSLVDWAKALINTLFGAALGLALGSLYASGRR